MYFPSRQLTPTRRSIFTVDGLLVSGVAVVWVATLVFAAMATGQSAVWLVAVGFVLPLCVWNALIGFVVYMHHTHTSVAWYDNKHDWSAASPFVSTTVHLTFGRGVGRFLHNIMEHTAHRTPCGHGGAAVPASDSAGFA